MFVGEYSHSIDAKGRMIIPACYREELGEKFYLVKGLDQCLAIYPEKDMLEFIGKLRTLPQTNKKARKLVRHFTSGAVECSLDKQGRILVPATLRDFAGLEKEIILAGNINRIEVWSKSLWEENSTIEDMDDVTEDLANNGIGF